MYFAWSLFITSFVASLIFLPYVENVCPSLKDALVKSKKIGYPKHPQETVDLIYNNCKLDLVDDRQFAYKFMDKITSTQMSYKKPDTGDTIPSWLKFTNPDEATIESYRKIYKKALKKSFTLRHYSSPGKPPAFTDILSSFGLRKQGISSANTNQNDWIYLGNTAFTFWLLCIDGEVPDRKFLKKATHYAEIKLDEESLKENNLNELDFFASGDLLQHAPKLSELKYHPTLMQGKLKDLAVITLGILKCELANTWSAKDILNEMDKELEMFEVKIPGKVALLSKEEWKENT